MAATDQQVQTFANERVRVRSEQIRSLLLAMEDDRTVLGDIYTYLIGSGKSWADTRIDVPHTLVANDILAWNTFIFNIIAAIRADSQLPIVLSCCVRPVNG